MCKADGITIAYIWRLISRQYYYRFLFVVYLEIFVVL